MMELSKQDMDSNHVAKWGFKPQKEIIYNKLLPDATQVDEDAIHMFSEIKANIGNSVMMRELRPGCALWASRLIKYIKFYGLKMSKEDHIHLIQLMYELVTIPNLESSLVFRFSRVLIVLLKKRELLSSTDLTLPWKPLYDTCARILANGRRSLGMYRYSSSLVVSLDSLVHAAKFYFPASATQEILDELRPLLCPFDKHVMACTVESLERFLPVALPPPMSDMGYKLWFEEMMSLWEMCNNAPSWEGDMMWLMARLACCNIGYIDWEPYIPFMFSRFLRSLLLPVSFRHGESTKNHKIETSVMALWIVSVLGGGSSAQKYLDKFMMALESYFYPANFGRWILKLSEFLSNLPLHFVNRVYFERFKVLTWETPVPQEKKLTEEDITLFVESVRSVAMKALYSKMGIEVTQAMKHLATLRPNLVIPGIVESVYTNLETVVQPRKFQAALYCLVAVTRSMMETGECDFKDGSSNIIPLLLAVLPGIDPNDFQKSFVVFHFISAVATMVPFVDCSKASEYHKNLTEEEETLCLATANFEDFVLQFFDRCFLLVESSALESTRLERDADTRSKVEKWSEAALTATCISILCQTSPAIFRVALKKTHDFVMSRIFESTVAGPLVACMCRCFAKVNSEETLHVFVPHICENILKEEIVDKELIYNILLLSKLLDCPAKGLLPHVPLLMKVLDRTLHMASREGADLMSRVLYLLLVSLSSVLPLEYRCVPYDFDEDLKHYLPVRDWGKPGNLYDLKIRWYVPAEEEFACVQSIVSRYLPEQIRRIEKYIEDESTMTRDELQSSLAVISGIFGCGSLLPLWDEEPLELVPSCLPQSPFKSIKSVGKHCVTLPDGSNVRKTIAMLMDRLQAKVLQCKEDDTKTFALIITIWGHLLSNYEDDNNKYESHRKKFRIVKKTCENNMIGNKRHLRSLLIDRALLQQEMQLDRNSLCLTATHKLILLNLLTLSTSHYSEVRSLAQESLFAALKMYPFSYTVLVDKLVEYLKKDTLLDHDQFKGALYVLLGPKQHPIVVLYDWDLLHKLWPAIIQANPSEKISVIRLLEKLAETVHKYFVTCSLHIEIPDSCVAAARKLWDSAPLPSQDPVSDEQVAQGLQAMKIRNVYNVDQYQTLLLSLNHCIENGNLHWRFHSMALRFLSDLVHPDFPYPSPVVRCFMNTLIHDSLELRKIAMRCVIFVLKQQKQTHAKIEVDPYSLSNVQKPEKVYPGNRPDNEWVQYKSSHIPQNAEEWNKPHCAHQVYHGYYDWPKKLKLYAPALENPPLMNPSKLSDGGKEVLSFFLNSSKVDKLMAFLPLEEKKGRDKFNGYKFLMFKGFFRNGGEEMLMIFLPYIEKLVCSKLEAQQRCASEIIAGVIRGAKHWPFEMVQCMWEKLTPLIRFALTNMTEETINDWGICFATAAENRDPHRNHWLFEVLMEEPPTSETSLMECGRLYSIQGAINQLGWRVPELLNKWLERLKPYLNHPFQNVRDRMGSVINNIFDCDVTFPGGNPPHSPRISDFLKCLMPQLTVLYIVASGAEACNCQYHNFVAETDRSNIDVSEDAKDSAIRLFKTVCRWISSSVQQSQFGISPYYYELFPLICLMETYEADEDLGRACTSVLVALGQAIHVPSNVSAGLVAIKKVSYCGSWQVKSTCLEFLQVFAFNNMPVILSSQTWTSEVNDIALRLLEDDWLDVREKSAEVLGGLLHIGFIDNSLELLDVFKSKVDKKLNKSELRADPVELKLRHSGILGLCAFINAYPYDVPEFIPELFVVLGQHLNDPQPIPTTIWKTLREFKRTHHDNWAQHSLKFTEEQLTVLTDLANPPSYYA